MYLDTERGCYITEEQLRREFEHLKTTSGTDAKTFSQYLNNCLDKNGTLEVVKW